jgi:DNA-binding transcriptional MerR regulator
MEQRTFKIGELAKLTGITVRTLHHYDQIGLLTPSQLTDKGHRIYTEKDIKRLQQVISLKQLGFSLVEIKELIGSQSLNSLQIIEMQLKSVKKQIALQEDLYMKLDGIYKLMLSQEDIRVNDFINLIEVTNMVEQYFSKEQLERMKQKTEQFSDEEKQQIEMEWAQLIANVRRELENNTPPENNRVIQLAIQWQELTNKVVAGDQEIVKAAERFHSDNQNNPLQYGVDKDLYLYITEAMSHI